MVLECPPSGDGLLEYYLLQTSSLFGAIRHGNQVRACCRSSHFFPSLRVQHHDYEYSSHRVPQTTTPPGPRAGNISNSQLLALFDFLLPMNAFSAQPPYISSILFSTYAGGAQDYMRNSWNSSFWALRTFQGLFLDFGRLFGAFLCTS